MSDRKERETFDQRVMGGEPSVPTLVGKTQNDMSGIFSWYTYMMDVNECVPWIISYMEDHEFSSSSIAKAKSLKPWSFHTTTFWLARMAQNGTVLGDEWEAKLKERIRSALSLGKLEVKEEDVPKPVPVDRSAEIVRSLIGDFESLLDGFICTGLPKDPKSYEFLRRCNARVGHVERVAAYYTGLCRELEDALEGKDEDLVYAYRRFNGKQLKAYVGWVKSLVSGCQAFSTAVRNERPRTVRKKKVKPVSDVVRSLKYAKGDESLKVASVDPTKIVGAKALYLYNTKYKKLQLYFSQNDLGFSVKGTTLTNFDEKLSNQKTLRWPEKQLQEMLSTGPAGAKKAYDQIKTASGPVTGRVNEHTIILRIDK